MNRGDTYPMTRFKLILVLLWMPVLAAAQDLRPVIVRAFITETDTLPVIALPEVVIFPPLQYKTAEEWKRYYRLVYNVKTVYPYARIAGIKMREYEALLVTLNNEQEKRAAMKRAEDQLRAEFQDDLMRFTTTQGWILLKLVDRETGTNTYDIVTEFRGKFRAFFWQSFARLFGFNLKVHYDPKNKDRDIERIVQLIESGAI